MLHGFISHRQCIYEINAWAYHHQLLRYALKLDLLIERSCWFILVPYLFFKHHGTVSPLPSDRKYTSRVTLHDIAITPPCTNIASLSGI